MHQCSSRIRAGSPGIGQKLHSATVSYRAQGTKTFAPRPRAAEPGDGRKSCAAGSRSGRPLGHDADARGQRLVACEGLAERLERHQPAPRGLQHAEALAQTDVVEDVPRVRVGLEREAAAAGPGVGLVARRRPRRVGVAEDAQAHALEDVAQELHAPGLRRLPARGAHEVVDRVVEERVLVTDDLLEGRRVRQLAGRALRLAPGDVVEVIVLERPVQVVGVAEAVLRCPGSSRGPSSGSRRGCPRCCRTRRPGRPARSRCRRNRRC